MNRKLFLTTAAPVSLVSSLMLSSGLAACKFGKWGAEKTLSEYDGRVLVLIQLDGGNDGLNTVIPLDKYEQLTQARKNILVPEKQVLALNNTSVTGLHPALQSLQKIYNNKKLAIVQGVGCSNPDLSHFKAIDIWHSGSDAATAVSTGWLGRYFDLQNGDKNEKADPQAIQIGSALTKVLQGPAKSAGMVVRDINSFYGLNPGHYHSSTGESRNDKLGFIRNMVIESKDYLNRVKSAAERRKNMSKMYPQPGTNLLADQLKIVARLIGGGMQTKVYIVNLKGFDTHEKQVDTANTTQGAHADLLAQISTAVAAFDDDLNLMNKQDKVVSMIYSEFGRRIKSNSGYGSDHGTAAPVLLFGANINGGITGTNPEIPGKATVNDNIPMQHDFRSVYISLLKDWFGVQQHIINATLPGAYPYLNLFAPVRQVS